MGLVKTCRGSSYALPHVVNYWNRKMSISSTGRHQLLTPTERDVPSTIKQEGEVKSLSRVRLFATSWRVAYQAPPSVGFSRQEYWSGLPFPSPGDLPNPGVEPRSPALEVDALTFEPPGKSIKQEVQLLSLPCRRKEDFLLAQ